MWELRILDSATRDLARVDAVVARRIVSRLRWLAESMDEIKPEALTGNLAGFYKLRAGDSCCLRGCTHSEQIILIHLDGHRREIYRDR
jgi:mRNA interferase RelE/StbE